MPKRYEVYYADLNPTLGSEIKKIRPVVIVSQNDMNDHLDTLVVCPMTSKIHAAWQSRVQVKHSTFKGEIAVDQIRTISRQRLKKCLGKISETEAAKVRKIITEMYGEP